MYACPIHFFAYIGTFGAASALLKTLHTSITYYINTCISTCIHMSFHTYSNMHIKLQSKQPSTHESVNFELINALPLWLTLRVCRLHNDTWRGICRRELVPKVPLVIAGGYDSNALPQGRICSVRWGGHSAGERYVYVYVCWIAISCSGICIARDAYAANILRSGKADSRKILAVDIVCSCHYPRVAVSFNIIVYVVPAVYPAASKVFALTGTRVCAPPYRRTWAEGSAANWLAAHTRCVSKWIWSQRRESGRRALHTFSLRRWKD